MIALAFGGWNQFDTAISGNRIFPATTLISYLLSMVRTTDATGPSQLSVLTLRFKPVLRASYQAHPRRR
jgi:hypothetical protein